MTLDDLIHNEVQRRLDAARAKSQPHGIWIPEMGWLKARDRIVAFDDVKFARHVARRLGGGAVAYPFDESVVALEHEFLSREHRRLRNKLKSVIYFLLRRIRSWLI